MNQAHRQIQRLAYSRKLAELQERMVDRLDQILSRYGDLEADALASLSDYAFIFEQYGEISGTQGIGQLLASAQELEKLNKKLRQMQDFGKGLELHMLDVGHLMNHPFQYVLVLSGDQLYRMDYQAMMRTHVQSGADVTIAALPVDGAAAKSCNIVDRRLQHTVVASYQIRVFLTDSNRQPVVPVRLESLVTIGRTGVGDEWRLAGARVAAQAGGRNG